MSGILSFFGCCCSRPPTHSVEIENFEKKAVAVAQNRIKADPQLKKKSDWKHFFCDLSQSKASPEQLAGVLETLAAEMAACEDPWKAIDRLVELMPPEIVETALKRDNDSFDLVQFAQDLHLMAEEHAKAHADQLPPDLRKRLYSAWTIFSGGAFSVLENTIMTMGFSELFKPVEGSTQQMMRMNKMMVALNIYQALATALMLWLGAQWGSSAFAGFLFTMIVLSVTYNKIKPMPNSLPPGTINMTQQYRKGKLAPKEVSRKILDQVSETLKTPEIAKKHPLIIGKSGQGKTVTVEAFVKAVEGRYPELKGKEIHYINAAELADKPGDMFGGSNSPLEKIVTALGDNQDNVILVIDEMHELWKNAGSGISLGAQLKTKLDASGGAFPRVIGITTWFDYATYIHPVDEAVARRFNFAILDDCDRKQTLDILRKTLDRLAPGAIVEEGVLEYLCEKTKKLPQPATPVKILADCVARTAESQKSELERLVGEIEENVTSLYHKARFQKKAGKEKTIAELRELKKERLPDLEKQLRTENQSRTRFVKIRSRWNAIEPTKYQRVLRISKLQQDILGIEGLDRTEKKQIVALVLMEHFISPAMKKDLTQQRKDLEINKSLIDTVILDEDKKMERMQKEFANAKTMNGKEEV